MAYETPVADVDSKTPEEDLKKAVLNGTSMILGNFAGLEEEGYAYMTLSQASKYGVEIEHLDD